MSNFWDDLKARKNEIILSSIGFVITGVIVAGTLGLGKEWLKQKIFERQTIVEIHLIDSAIGAFQSQDSQKLTQLMAYEISASDLVKNIKVIATFFKTTEVKKYNVIYSVDVQGFNAKQSQSNHIEITLDHPLDVSKKAFIYLLLERKIHGREDIELEIPNIHVEGKDRKGNIVYD